MLQYSHKYYKPFVVDFGNDRLVSSRINIDYLSAISHSPDSSNTAMLMIMDEFRHVELVKLCVLCMLSNESYDRQKVLT